MMKLNKIQKILILASIFWEMFAYNISYYNYGHRLDFEKFMLASSPVILYWSVVWIWGFGTFVKLFNKFKNSDKIREGLKYFIYFIVFLSFVLKYIEKYFNYDLNNLMSDTTIGFIRYSFIAVIIFWLLFIFFVPVKEKNTEKEKSKNYKTKKVITKNKEDGNITYINK